MKIISFSGIDGSGKTQLAQRLAAALRGRGVNAVYGRPEYACNAKVMRYCEMRFGNEYAYYPSLPPDFYISILSVDWLVWYMDFLRGLPDDAVVCCDRYIIDVYAQAVQYGARLEPLQEVFSVFPVPELTVFLETPPDVAVARIAQRGSPAHRLESLEHLTELFDSYAVAADRVGWTFTRLNNAGGLESTLQTVLGWLEERQVG